MIYIYVELRYQRQLNRICPEVLKIFYNELASSVLRNGGTEIRISSGRLFQFDESAVGNTFASSRVLGNLHTLLEENTDRIREYFILVSHLKNPISGDAFTEHLSVYANLLLPAQGILITTGASALFDSYLTIEPLADTPFFIYTGLKLSGIEVLSKSKTAKDKQVLSIYTDFALNPISTFRNLTAMCTLPEEKKPSTKEELAVFIETRYALQMYEQFRFSSVQPEYRLGACVEYLSLFFQSLKKGPKSPLEVYLIGTKALSSSFGEIMEKMQEHCRFSPLTDPLFAEVDLTVLPDDLLELTYLVYKASFYLFIDELSAFFAFLGKQAEFLDALADRMHAYGILCAYRDFRSLNPLVLPEVELKLGSRRKDLDGHIARFLWSKHEDGKLQPCFSFYEALIDLKFPVPDSFLVSCLYHSSNAGTELVKIKDKFRIPALFETVEKLELARNKYEWGSFEESSALAKNVLHVFQKEHVLAGEYRTLSLMAMLSLARNSCDDSVVYLEYALENAEKMHDSSAILCTTFDMAMVYFINGNFHFALCTLETVEKIIGTCYAKDWEVLLFFMKGRIAFELGNYRDAELLFQTAASLASVNLIPESVALCRVWYARSLSHLNRFATAQNILESCVNTIPEAYIFLLEAGLLSGRTVMGIDFPESLVPLFSSEEYWTAEKITWTSGFSIAEDRCYGSSCETRLASRMYEAFSLYYRSRFNLEGDVSQVVSKLAVIARKALDITDPYAALYYYFCYDLGNKRPEVLPADTTTFLSRGFKYMQKRANEIEDNGVREQFMQNPTWNSRLYRNARENMLI